MRRIFKIGVVYGNSWTCLRLTLPSSLIIRSLRKQKDIKQKTIERMPQHPAKVTPIFLLQMGNSRQANT